ncbi:MAG: pro-sigmaK processing inhibitor BofA family protein [Firmicutes bacterium]|nr:pro-sigmaK processing inhibitor BofA family protein [Bacillota bacterium]
MAKGVMNMPVYVVYAGAAVAVYVLFSLLIGRDLGQSLGAASGNLLLGYGSMALVNALTPNFGFAVPVNAVTLLAGGWLGLPGTVLAAALQLVA